jgi:hypothetical protein
VRGEFLYNRYWMMERKCPVDITSGNVVPDAGVHEEKVPSFQLRQYHKARATGEPIFGINVLHSAQSIGGRMIQVGYKCVHPI